MRRSEVVPLSFISHPLTFHLTIHLNEEECQIAFTCDRSMDLGHDA